MKTIVLDGVYTWSYTPLLNEVNKQKIQNPQRREILPGTGATLEELSNNWNMKLVPDEAANAKGIYQMQFDSETQSVQKRRETERGR